MIVDNIKNQQQLKKKKKKKINSNIKKESKCHFKIIKC